MKTTLSLTLIILFQFFNCQTINANYEYSVKSVLLQKFINFPATLQYNNIAKLYIVDFGINTKEEVADNVFISKNKFKYILFSKNKDKTLIFDNLQEKNFIFEDNFDFDWKLSNEKKVVENIQLYKATSYFRGRNYIIWFSKNNKFAVGPWKFNNLPGLVYEAYDEDNKFRWELKDFKITKENVINPIVQDEKLTVHPYSDYAKLKYGLSPELEAALKNNPNNTMFEQERDGLETKFEWERK